MAPTIGLTKILFFVICTNDICARDQQRSYYDRSVLHKAKGPLTLLFILKINTFFDDIMPTIVFPFVTYYYYLCLRWLSATIRTQSRSTHSIPRTLSSRLSHIRRSCLSSPEIVYTVGRYDELQQQH